MRKYSLNSKNTARWKPCRDRRTLLSLNNPLALLVCGNHARATGLEAGCLNTCVFTHASTLLCTWNTCPPEVSVSTACSVTSSFSLSLDSHLVQYTVESRPDGCRTQVLASSSPSSSLTHSVSFYHLLYPIGHLREHALAHMSYMCLLCHQTKWIDLRIGLLLFVLKKYRWFQCVLKAKHLTFHDLRALLEERSSVPVVTQAC